MDLFFRDEAGVFFRLPAKHKSATELRGGQRSGRWRNARDAWFGAEARDVI
jgi:hypothetical protein